MNTAKITEKQQVVCGIIKEMNQVILFLLILNLLNTRQALQEVLVAGYANYDANKVYKNKAEVITPLKHLSNCWMGLNKPLINCELELILDWPTNCVFADITAANNPPTGLEFRIIDTKLYFSVVILSKENDTKLLEQLKSGVKRNIKWNK